MFRTNFKKLLHSNQKRWKLPENWGSSLSRNWSSTPPPYNMRANLLITQHSNPYEIPGINFAFRSFLSVGTRGTSGLWYTCRVKVKVKRRSQVQVMTFRGQVNCPTQIWSQSCAWQIFIVEDWRGNHPTSAATHFLDTVTVLCFTDSLLFGD